MGQVRCISYNEWADLVAAVIKNGLSCAELQELAEVYPQVAGSAYDALVFQQLGKLEEYMLRETFRLFQKGMDTCLEEMDLEVAEAAIIKFKKHMSGCLFFLRIPEYPESVKAGMSDEIKKNIDSYRDSFSKYLKGVEAMDSSAFIQDFVYICRKKFLKVKLL